MTDVAEIGAPGAKVEEKLFQNRYLVDAGRPHIKIRPHEVPSKSSRVPHLCLSRWVLQLER